MARKLGKTLGKAALLGGAALLASRMMKGKDDKEDKSMPTETGAGAAETKDRLGGIGLDRGDKDTMGDMSAGQARDRLADLEKAGAGKRTPTRTTPTRTAPTRAAAKDQKMEGDTASGMPREARGAMADRTARERELGVFGARGKNPGPANPPMMKKGGMVKSSASKRADGICKKGKTKGRMV
jgi:hypothetical protein